MKIAINCAFYQPRGGGIAEYIFNLVNNIGKIDKENDDILYVLKDQLSFARRGLPGGFRIKTIPFGSSYTEVLKRSIFEQQFWNREEETEKFDIFHSPFFHSPSFKHAKVVVTVHDMRFFRFPYTYTMFRYIYLRYKVKKSVMSADRIITISQFTKDELLTAYDLSPEKIAVIHEAINPERFGTKPNEGVEVPLALTKCPFVLSVGHIEPRKNYDRLIDAFIRIIQNPSLSNTKLVIVGKKGHHYKQTLKKMQRSQNVVYLDFVSHELLLWLYRNACLFMFPTYYEGFGFPPLEAGAAGTISAVSNVSSMPEVCGDAVAFFNPYDIDEMASVMEQCITNSTLRENLRNKMKIQLQKFTWEENAISTIALYKELYNKQSGGGNLCSNILRLAA